MNDTAKAKRLHDQLDSLSLTLGPVSTQANTTPRPRKTIEGSDRFGGYPPA